MGRTLDVPEAEARRSFETTFWGLDRVVRAVLPEMISRRSGTVLALNRAIVVSDEFDGSSEHLSQLIQIHGDLQPGDSGGPMVNGAGAVIGMDTAASTDFALSGPTTGQGFAIEIDAVGEAEAT